MKGFIFARLLSVVIGGFCIQGTVDAQGWVTWATEALERDATCRNIVKAGGKCPDDSVSLGAMRAYYRRLVDDNWAAYRVEQRRQLEQADLELRVETALQTALLSQDAQFKQITENIQTDLKEGSQQTAENFAAFAKAFNELRDTVSGLQSEIEQLRNELASQRKMNRR